MCRISITNEWWNFSHVFFSGVLTLVLLSQDCEVNVLFPVKCKSVLGPYLADFTPPSARPWRDIWYFSATFLFRTCQLYFHNLTNALWHLLSLIEVRFITELSNFKSTHMLNRLFFTHLTPFMFPKFLENLSFCHFGTEFSKNFEVFRWEFTENLLFQNNFW